VSCEAEQWVKSPKVSPSVKRVIHSKELKFSCNLLSFLFARFSRKFALETTNSTYSAVQSILPHSHSGTSIRSVLKISTTKCFNDFKLLYLKPEAYATSSISSAERMSLHATCMIGGCSISQISSRSPLAAEHPAFLPCIEAFSSARRTSVAETGRCHFAMNSASRLEPACGIFSSTILPEQLLVVKKFSSLFIRSKISTMSASAPLSASRFNALFLRSSNVIAPLLLLFCPFSPPLLLLFPPSASLFPHRRPHECEEGEEGARKTWEKSESYLIESGKRKICFRCRKCFLP